MREEVRVRFAPSPTGYLHVGGARTALFNWLFARNKGGKFILRIEDTDRQRSSKKYLNDILYHMEWLGLKWDEGPILQTERIPVYQEYAQKLLEIGVAYKTDRPPVLKEGEEVSKVIGEVVVFKVPKEKVKIDDIVHGDIEFDTEIINDFIIIKSDGTPTYNFACVIDDALMSITHIIRGDDHISNTPKQILLYKALGFPIPRFAHVPMILGPDGSRLSKRHGATSVGEYRRQGFLPEVLVNFLALLGWSPGGDIEIMKIDDLIASFDLSRVTGKSAVFNIEKLTWMNSVYLSEIEDSRMIELCRPYLEMAGYIDSNSEERLEKIIPLFKKRIKVVSEIVDATDYFFRDEIEYQPEGVEKFLKKEGASEILLKVKEALEGVEEYNLENIERVLRSVAEQLQVSNRVLMQTIRVAVTGRTVSPGIFETLAGLGKDLTLKHIDKAIAICKGA